MNSIQGMRKSNTKWLVLIIRLLVEGKSISATARTAYLSKTTITKFLEDADEVRANYLASSGSITEMLRPDTNGES